MVRLGFLPPEEDDESDDPPDAVKLATVLREWETAAPKDRILIGFTATPNRSDAVGLGCVFQTIAYTYPIKKAIDDGWLAPIRSWVVSTKTDLDGVRIRAGEFDQRQLAEAVNTPERNKLGVAAWKQYADGLQTLGFTVDVQHARDAVAAFQVAGIPAQMVSGETPKDERRAILADYSRCRFPVLLNCMVLTEGTDLPATSCILVMKPTRSATLYEQIIGRGLRMHPGKTECIVIDLVDIARRHSLQTAPTLYGLPPLKAEGKNLRDFEREIEDFQQRYPSLDIGTMLAQHGALTLEALNAAAQSFDVWKVPPMGDVGAGLSMKWIKVGENAFRLQYPWGSGTEVLRIDRNMIGQYEIVLTVRPLKSDGVIRQSTIATQLPDAKTALRSAEAFLANERRTVSALKDKNAFWRRGPATEKQIAILRRRRVPFNPRTLTKGDASDLIDLANARRTQ